MAAESNSPRPQRSRIRMWLLRLSVLGFSLLMVLVAFEVAVRTLQLATPWTPENRIAIVLFHQDPAGPIEMTPNWEGYVGVYRLPVRLNGDGFRDRAYSPTPPSGTARIAIIGDSYTMGDGISRKEAYPKQLEERLRQKLPCEVMNCGITATNSHNQLPLVTRLIESYRPHLIVLGYNVNDFYYRKLTRFESLKAAGYHYEVHDDQTVMISKPPSGFVGRVKTEILKRSYGYRFAQRIRNPVPRPVGIERIEGWIKEDGHLRSFAAVKEMSLKCKAAGVDFVVMIIPSLLDVLSSITRMDDYPFKEQHATIIKEMESTGIQVFDVTDDFGDRNPNDLIAHPLDRHYNPEGCAIVAEAMEKRLLPSLSKYVAHQ